MKNNNFPTEQETRVPISDDLFFNFISVVFPRITYNVRHTIHLPKQLLCLFPCLAPNTCWHHWSVMKPFLLKLGAVNKCTLYPCT